MLGSPPLHPVSWTLAAPPSRVSVSVRHLGVGHFAGEFQRFTGRLRADVADALRGLEFTVDARSLVAGRDQHTRHLRALFGSDEHPSLHFRSDWAHEKGRGREAVQGTLTMHGRTHVVELVAAPGTLVTDAAGRRWYATTVTGALDRRQWGVPAHGPIELGGLVVGHEVALRLELHAPVVEG
jgi:polyisoprenoid-binding protein YceI